MTTPDATDVLTRERGGFRTELIAHGWLLPSRTAVLPGLGPQANAVYDGLAALISRTTRARFAAPVTAVRFPPVFSASMLERTDYVASFPQLLGTISSFTGEQSEYRELIDVYDRGGDWQGRLSPTGLAVASAACHPLYAYLEGTTAAGATVYEMTGECFRHEPSDDPMRFVAFRMREYVVVGSEQQARAHRVQGIAIARGIFEALGLVIDVVPANDPFFGRGGAMLAASQLQDEAKFELVTEVYAGRPTAIGSGNYHGTHFGAEFALHQADGTVAHSACSAYGMERIVFALAARHGFEIVDWPPRVRELLGLADVGAVA
ncbi:MAG: hypothetical protein FWD85_00105 [Microbacteriaceae bacterium]|nr:hypothetical protein [Microbacteriaceae bacterium]MCL2793685.1 hypothetical protein [Microbacteriaceae bacterium]